MGLREFFRRVRGGSGSGTRIDLLQRVAATEDGDAQVLNQMRAAGADLDKPTHVLFYIYVPSEEAARRLARTIDDSLLEPEVRRAANGGDWLCLLQGRLIPSHATLKGYRERFDLLASSEGGQYDGWEAAIVK